MIPPNSSKSVEDVDNTLKQVSEEMQRSYGMQQDTNRKKSNFSEPGSNAALDKSNTESIEGRQIVDQEIEERKQHIHKDPVGR